MKYNIKYLSKKIISSDEAAKLNNKNTIISIKRICRAGGDKKTEAIFKSFIPDNFNFTIYGAGGTGRKAYNFFKLFEKKPVAVFDLIREGKIGSNFILKTKNIGEYSDYPIVIAIENLKTCTEVAEKLKLKGFKRIYRFDENVIKKKKNLVI